MCTRRRVTGFAFPEGPVAARVIRIRSAKIGVDAVSVYMVIEARVKDSEKYKKYISQVPKIAAKYGGSYLVRGGKVTPILGDWTPERMIILKFPSETHIRTWLSSPEYQEISPSVWLAQIFGQCCLKSIWRQRQKKLISRTLPIETRIS